MPRGVYERKLFPQKVQEYIATHSEKMTIRDLCGAVNEQFGTEYTYDQLQGYLKRKKIKHRRYKPNALLTEEQVEHLKLIVKGRKSEEIADMMNRQFGLNLTAKQISAWKKNHRIQSGYDTRFLPGNASWHKRSKPKANSGSFKKGRTATNALPVGTVSRHKFAHDSYQWAIKVQDGNGNQNFVSLARWVWEQANGKVPDGHVVIFLDGDKDNCTLENLAVIPRSVNIVVNRHIGYTEDPELNKTIIQTARLILAVTRKKKEANEQR